MSRDLIEQDLGWRWDRRRVVATIDNPESVVIKIARGGSITGFAIMRIGRHESHLDLLAVRPRSQRRGIGTALLVWLETSALTAGASIVRLEVRKSNYPAQRFYKALGYSIYREVPGYYQGQDTALQMAKDLWQAAALSTSTG